jgi:hypothetical protein
MSTLEVEQSLIIPEGICTQDLQCMSNYVCLNINEKEGIEVSPAGMHC